jgi:hypothetical protein
MQVKADFPFKRFHNFKVLFFAIEIADFPLQGFILNWISHLGCIEMDIIPDLCPRSVEIHSQSEILQRVTKKSKKSIVITSKSQ